MAQIMQVIKNRRIGTRCKSSIPGEPCRTFTVIDVAIYGETERSVAAICGDHLSRTLETLIPWVTGLIDTAPQWLRP